jgi:RHS repeat-associated protein
LLATISPKEGLQQVVVDHQGSAALLANRCGRCIAELATNPWGLDVFDATQNPERHRYTGHLRDVNAASRAWDDFDQMHARTYFPYTARFLSPDPGRDYDLFHPQSFNLYAYVRNNPVNAVDPSGKWLVLETDPLSTRYLRSTRSALIEALRRPTTRYLLVTLAGDTSFRVAFGAKSLNSPATWAAFRQGEKEGRFHVNLTFATTKASRGAGGVAGANVSMDWPVINGPGRLTGHQGGLTTLDHEVGSHVMDLYAGKNTCAITLTDDNGFAEALGRDLAAEPPDMSRKEAEKLLDELLALGKQLEEEYQKQLVMVTSNTNPVTQKSEGDRP